MTKFSHAQLSGDLRNLTIDISKMIGEIDEFATSAQTDEKGSICASGGITVKEEEKVTKVSFDHNSFLITDVSGFWKGREGQSYRVSFFGKKGKINALVELEGIVRWNKQRKITEGLNCFEKIMTSEEEGKWYSITKRVIKNGNLLVTSAKGETFILSNYSPEFKGSIEKYYEKKGCFISPFYTLWR